MLSWFHHLRNIGTSWAVFPTHKKSCKEIASCLMQSLRYWDANTEKTIIEIWVWTGNVTEQLLMALREIDMSVNVFGYEVNQKFYPHIANTLGSYENFTLIEWSAEYISTDFAPNTVHGVVSTAPLSMMWEIGDKILEQASEVLKPWWSFVIWQYRTKQNARIQEIIWPQKSSTISRAISIQPFVHITRFETTK